MSCCAQVWAALIYLMSLVCKCVARVAMNFMYKEHVAELVKSMGHSSDCSIGDDGSNWSVVSEASPTPSSRKKSRGEEGARSLPSTSICSHHRVSRSGTNGDSIQLKCADCGFLLLKQSTPAGLAKKAKRDRANRTRSNNEISRSM